MHSTDAALLYAISSENLAGARVLLAAGANVNAVDGSARTPLHFAVGSLWAKGSKLLLNYGANPNAQDIAGDSPLHWAAGSVDWVAPVSWLLQRGADVNLADRHGRTTLHCAARNGNPRIVSRLLPAGSPVGAQDNRGYTALHHAVRGCCESGVRRLLWAGADPRARDQRGNTPLHLAARINWRSITEALLRAGASPRDRNHAGRRPLELTVGERRGVGAWPAVLLLRREPRVSQTIMRNLLLNTVRRASEMTGSDLLVENLLQRGVSPAIVTNRDFRLLIARNWRENKFWGTSGYPAHTIQVLRLLAAHCPIPPGLTVLLL